MKPLIFDIPRNTSVKQLETRLKQRFRLRLQTAEVVTRTYLDTFDWRIFHACGVLEASLDNSGIWLVWRSLGATRVYAKYPLDKIPRFVWDLKESGLRSRLEEIVDVRALLPVAIVQSRIRLFNILNNQDKTILHAEIQRDGYPYQAGDNRPERLSTVVSKRIHLFPMKGYEKGIKKIYRYLQEECRLVPVSADPLVTTLKQFQITPGYRIQKQVISVPDLPADIAVKRIFLQLLEQMEINEDGTRHDIDSEFLHNFRVAVRRTRSLLGQIKGVLPQTRVARFSRDFAWLGTTTGPARDMDVYLLMFDAYKMSLPPKMREDLIPFYKFLRDHKNKEHGHIIKVLDSARYKKFKQDWRRFITAASPVRSTLINARRPIINVASERIWRIYRKAIRQGSEIRPDSPADALHVLRKTLKKLRYLNEFFQNLYPKNKMLKLIGSLKVLQDNLGEFQDLEIQQASLRKFILVMEKETGITSATRNDMELLVTRLSRRNNKVRADFDRYFREFAAPSNRLLYKKIIASRRNGQDEKNEGPGNV